MRLGPRRDSDWARRAGAGGWPRGGPLPLDPGLEGRAGPAAARAATAALLLRPGGRPPSHSRGSSCPMATCTTAASASAAAAGPRPALPGAADSDGLACPRASARRQRHQRASARRQPDSDGQRGPVWGPSLPPAAVRLACAPGRRWPGVWPPCCRGRVEPSAWRL